MSTYLPFGRKIAVTGSLLFLSCAIYSERVKAEIIIEVLKPKAELRTVQKKSVLETSTVKNDFFSVSIPKGWSFVATTYAIAHWKQVGKVQAYITAAPIEDIEHSPIFFWGARSKRSPCKP